MLKKYLTIHKLDLAKGSQYGYSIHKNERLIRIWEFERFLMKNVETKTERENARLLMRTFEKEHPRAINILITVE